MDSEKKAGRPRKGDEPLSAAEKKRAQRERDKLYGVTQINVKIPNTIEAKEAIKDLALKLRRKYAHLINI